MKVPKPRKLKSGNWFIQLRLGGQSYPITEPTEKLCVQKAQLLKAEYLAGQKQDRLCTANTLDSLLENYIRAKKAVLSPSTVRGYEAIRRTRFKSYMMRDPARINWQRMVSDEARLCGPKTLENAWALVSPAIKYSGQSVPSVTLPQVVSDEHVYLEPEQITVFLDAMRGKSFETAALLALHSLRRSEAFALTWNDVDLKANTLSVRGAVVHDETGKLVKKKENKNRTSRRTIPIMIPRLAELLSEVPQEERTGRILKAHPNSAYKAINTVCARAGLPLAGYQGLRHSFASLAHSLGVPEMECANLGGWKDLNTMRKIYTHLDKKARLKASNAISEFYAKNQDANAKTLTRKY